MATTRFSSEAEALAKMREPATTIAAKRMILDARDFIYRERKSKNRDLNAQAVIGTCQDMCPEQERLFRIENNCVHTYEMNENGEPDEERMVKEYRRSGADQNEPLPHDLRDAATMLRTMDYLCLEIVDNVDAAENLGSWYEFVWDRTRCFRKDITLQMICNPDSVQLIEKCARFHIFCSYYLCTEKPHNFDIKINNKNLADCIQSLKEQYHDLEKKSNQYSPNEAEFMAYDILLNMHNFEAVHDVKNYRQVVRESPNVQLAFKIHAAFQCKDITGFFKLLDQCDFFQLCVLNSIINPFRVTCFNIIRRAFLDRSKDVVNFPKSLIIEMFRFADVEELDNFCNHYEIEYSDDKITLPRPIPYTIGVNHTPLLSRSDNLVIPKCKQSFGRAILGNDGPSAFVTKFPLYSSFENDRYRWSDFIEAPASAPSSKPTFGQKSVISITSKATESSGADNPFGIQKMSVFNPFIMKPENKTNTPTSAPTTTSSSASTKFSTSTFQNPFKTIDNPFKSTENLRPSLDSSSAKKNDNDGNLFRSVPNSFFGSDNKQSSAAGAQAGRLPSFTFIPPKNSSFSNKRDANDDENNVILKRHKDSFLFKHDENNRRHEEDDDDVGNEENGSFKNENGGHEDVDDEDYADDDVDVGDDDDEDERLIDEYAEAFTDMMFEAVARNFVRRLVQEKLQKRFETKLIKSTVNCIISQAVKDIAGRIVEQKLYRRHQKMTEIVYFIIDNLYIDCLHETLIPVIEKPITEKLEHRRQRRIKYLSSKYFNLWRFGIHQRTSRKAFFPSTPGVRPSLFVAV